MPCAGKTDGLAFHRGPCRVAPMLVISALLPCGRHRGGGRAIHDEAALLLNAPLLLEGSKLNCFPQTVFVGMKQKVVVMRCHRRDDGGAVRVEGRAWGSELAKYVIWGSEEPEGWGEGVGGV